MPKSKLMKKYACFSGYWPGLALVILLFVFLGESCSHKDSSRAKILKIYNWADYIDEDLLKEFPVWYKQQTGEEVKIVYQVFDMNEVMYTKIALGKEDFDLVCPTQAIIERMIDKDLLLPLNRDFGKTFDNISSISPFLTKWLNTFNAKGLKASGYVVPYMWGVSGILYNTKLVSKDDVKSWECLWDPKNKGKILMKDSYWDAYNIASIYGNYADIKSGARTLYEVANQHTDKDIEVVGKQLKKLRENVAGWEADFGKEMMTRGEIWLSYAWSGDAVWAIDEASTVNVSLDFIVPQEGSNVWFDGWVIPKYAKNIKAASYFLNFICKPENALKNMEISGYTSAVATPEIAEAISDSTSTEPVNLSYFFGPGHDSLFVNPVQYPSGSVISNCALLHDFLDKNEKVLEMWSKVKGDSLNKVNAFLVFGSFLLLAGFLIYRKIRKYLLSKRKTHRKYSPGGLRL